MVCIFGVFLWQAFDLGRFGPCWGQGGFRAGERACGVGLAGQKRRFIFPGCSPAGLVGSACVGWPCARCCKRAGMLGLSGWQASCLGARTSAPSD